jgi:two-component system, NtrC family, sensor kinase
MNSKILILLILFNNFLYAQIQVNKDSLKEIINLHKGDTNEVNALYILANQNLQTDSAIQYARQGMLLARKINFLRGEADCLFSLALSTQSNFSRSIQYTLNSLNIYENIQNKYGIAMTNLFAQAMYRQAGDYKEALHHAFAGLKIAEINKLDILDEIPVLPIAISFLAEISQTYIMKNQPDSALVYAQKAIEINKDFRGSIGEFSLYLLAYIQNMKGNYQPALDNFRLAKQLAIQSNPRDTLQIYSGMSSLFLNMRMLDSAIYYAQIVVRSWNIENSEAKNILEAVSNLAKAYKLKGDKDSLLKYVVLNQSLNDSFYSNKKDREVQNIVFSEKLRQEEILSAEVKYKSRVQLYGFGAGLITLLLIAGLLWRSNRNKQKAKSEIEKAFTELKSTQTQLIQSEKMASLGELTAGIAHEIQNPLNFINNFSEVNEELLMEMNYEIDRGNMDEVKAIAKDITENEKKINHHGKRADAIVKGMLQHSRTSTGQKEPSDINALVDEYLRLSYHGLRARDKTFNVTMQTDFDESIGNINIIPQDIGRVLLNLYNNAFYAVSEKQKQSHVVQATVPALEGSAKEVYEPTVSVSTKKRINTIEIRVKDNGNGMPLKVLDKIFQPFFTTKPTGQGTGLGLSLSYDMIKAHGGEIKVESKAGEGTTFIVVLPLSV